MDDPTVSTGTGPETGSPAAVVEDLTAEPDLEEAAVLAAPEILASSLGEYLRAWWQRTRSGESGALPIIVGLVLLFLAVEFLAVRRHATGEPLVVEKLEQSREAFRVPVVGRGRQEELVFEVGGEGSDRVRS